jgi:hypothetical protein
MQCQGPGCTNPIVQVPGGHRARKYCSDRCRVAAGRQNRAAASLNLKPVKAKSKTKLVKAESKTKPVKVKAKLIPARTAKKPIRRTRTSSRLTRGDMQALNALDRLLEEDRRVEQKYQLPFRSPRQVATTTHTCAHCQRDMVFLIFGDLARDAAGLEAYGRLMADLIERTALPAYVIAPPDKPGDLDGPALLLRVYPSRDEEARFTTPSEWEELIKTLSDEHCGRVIQSRIGEETQ